MSLVTAIIPTWNRVNSLGRAIDSALSQRGATVEVVVVDDGSTDGTREMLRNYGERIRVVYQQQGGAASARNAGIAIASGEFIAFLDSDDEWLPQKTELQLRQFENNPKLGIAACGAWFLENGTVYDIHWQATPGSLRNRLLTGPINTSGVMVRSRFLRELPCHFRVDLTAYEDSELWWRLTARHESLMLPTQLVRSHRTGSSVSTTLPLDARIRSVESFYRYVLADEAVPSAIGSAMKSFLSHRHYIASCACYVNGCHRDAWAEWLSGIREDPWNCRWLRLAAVITLPPSLRPPLKRFINWFVSRR